MHDLGKLEYESGCASCHGLSGKGDGSLRNHLTKPPSDLTTLAKRNGGAFPTQLVWEMIDGRSSTDMFWYGSREMPVWGLRYRVDAMKDPATMGQPEWYACGRIVARLDDLARIQQE
ncbi:c-type cytochrome [Azohydromonas sediminis]|uniref:c-type cytochrome n=1 Tax=Azohydromonas sediminis TaxID=2259674 RepID=UPI001B357A87|nr:c-type cytochrome [Azohydromonas sediminis]